LNKIVANNIDETRYQNLIMSKPIFLHID